MKIFLPFKVQDIGGTSIFATKFKLGMERLRHEVFFEFREDYDILLLIAQAPLKYLIHAKSRKKKIVQRLDGVYYWSVSSWKFPLFNAKATYIRHLFTDFTVYQSAYSKYCVERFLGKKSSEESAVIHNGVDLTIFNPSGRRMRGVKENPQQKIFFIAAAFRREEQIVPIIEAVLFYAKLHDPNVKLLIAGNFTREAINVPEKYRGSPIVRFLGKVKNNDIPAYERVADIFLHTHLNPPCPNNVIEAMACGLPICGVADGSMRELVEEGKNGLLVPTAGDAFWRRRSIDVRALADNMHRIIENKEKYSKESRRIAEERFSLDEMISKYATFLERLAV